MGYGNGVFVSNSEYDITFRHCT